MRLKTVRVTPFPYIIRTMYRFVLVLLCVAALHLQADRVRVVIALTEAASTAKTGILRTATDVEVWGEGPAFAAEIDRAELESLRRDPRVRAISIDEGGVGALMESVPLVGGDLVHAQGIDGRGATIAILDTGLDAAHRDFAGRIAAEQCFCDNLDGTGCCPGGDIERSGPGAAADDHDHGTHVAGIAAGAGAVAPMGVAPRANIVAVKVMDAQNRFRSFTQVYRALEWIADHRLDVDVINMSLGSSALFDPSQCDAAAIALGLQPLIARLRARGVLIAASTGNDGSPQGMSLPACMQEVLAVGATFDSAGNHCGVTSGNPDEVACFTNSNPAMDLLAPGSAIYASRRGGGGVTLSGTSMAAPHVAGTILLMKQVGGGSLAADTIENVLEQTGTPVTDARNQLTFPRLNTAAAVSATPRAIPPPRRRSVRR